MKIQEVAEKTGITAHTLRFYEKEGLLDRRHVCREKNNYRTYSEETIKRLKLIKKFQNIGCSVAELKEILQDHNTNTRTNEEVIDWITNKICDIENKKREYDQMLDTLNMMLEYRNILRDDPDRAAIMLKNMNFD